MTSESTYRVHRDDTTRADKTDDKSLGDLVGDLTSEISRLFEDHVELAKREVRQDAKQAAQAGGALGAAAVLGLVALITLSLAAGWGLAEVMAPGWAFLIVGVAWAAIAAALAAAGKQRLDHMEPGPRQTIDELKEDQQWMRTGR